MGARLGLPMAEKCKPIMANNLQAHKADPDAGHQNALDGIRGIAVTMVIFFHSIKLGCGWSGVQIFFVLSGFLITSILLRDSDLPVGFYLKRFYWRRALRIFPLYYGYVLVMAIIFALFKAPAPFGQDWPYLLTYTLNFRHISPNFGPGIYYGRFWTLAVEEQFYLVWPLLIYFFPRKYFAGLIMAILVIGPVFRGVSAYLLGPFLHSDSLVGQAVYYLTPGQMDSFAAGAAIVLFGNRLRRRSIAVFIGCTVVLLACGQLNAFLCTGKLALNHGLGYEVNMFRGYQHIWGYTLINFWAGSLILVASSKNWISSLLAFPYLAYLGKISYGMYVYHQIILYAGLLRFGSLYMNTRHGFLYYYLAVVLISSLSYRFYESRFLALKNDRFTLPITHPSGRTKEDVIEPCDAPTGDEKAMSI